MNFMKLRSFTSNNTRYVVLMCVCHFHRQIVFDLLTLYLLMAYCKVAIVTQVLWCHSEDELCASRKGEFVQ